MFSVTEEEMGSEVITFYQGRIVTAYQEQIWAVTLVGAMNAFVASHSESLIKGFPLWILQAGISCFSLLAIAFVLVRHRIFAHYDQCIKEELRKMQPDSAFSSSFVPRYQEVLAGWSGVILYILIILALWTIAFRMLAVTP